MGEMNKENILKCLRKGKENSITGKSIARMFGQKNDRAIRLLILELIHDGIPVASTTHPPYGYYIAERWDEVHEYIEVTLSRLRRDANRIKLFRIAAQKTLPPEQGVLL